MIALPLTTTIAVCRTRGLAAPLHGRRRRRGGRVAVGEIPVALPAVPHAVLALARVTRNEPQVHRLHHAPLGDRPRNTPLEVPEEPATPPRVRLYLRARVLPEGGVHPNTYVTNRTPTLKFQKNQPTPRAYASICAPAYSLKAACFLASS
eukprot:1176991-Prorocentrum_minimum.AAC.13